MKPFISICIPAYKPGPYFKRLMESIATQTFQDYEVVISDDSPGDDSLKHILNNFGLSQLIRYTHNPLPLGSPENWNNAIRQARGQWIKIMHDDDWFSDNNSLELFANMAKHTSSDFIFSGFCNVWLEEDRREVYTINEFEHWLLKKSPLNLFRKNFIGHPSTTLIRNNRTIWYNPRLKWVVDFEFYMRAISEAGSFEAIRRPLINIGIGSDQITKAVFRRPEVEIPENLFLLNSITPAASKRIFVYDYYWRFLRNLSIREVEIIAQYTTERIPPVITQMIAIQKRIPASLLKTGIISKILMAMSYCYSHLFNKFTP